MKVRSEAVQTGMDTRRAKGGFRRRTRQYVEECDWHGQEIGGERRKAQVLSRSPDEGNPTPM
jgi:hypothetical protein